MTGQIDDPPERAAVILAALRRSAVRARRLAALAGVPLVIVREGKIVKIPATSPVPDQAPSP